MMATKLQYAAIAAISNHVRDHLKPPKGHVSCFWQSPGPQHTAMVWMECWQLVGPPEDGQPANMRLVIICAFRRGLSDRDGSEGFDLYIYPCINSIHNDDDRPLLKALDYAEIAARKARDEADRLTAQKDT